MTIHYIAQHYVQQHSSPMLSCPHGLNHIKYSHPSILSPWPQVLPFPQPSSAPTQAAACLCPLHASLTLVPLSVSLLHTVHVTVSAVTDQGLKGNTGEKVSAGRQPACANSLTVGGLGAWSKVQCVQASWFISGRLWALSWIGLRGGFISEEISHNDWITCIYSLWNSSPKLEVSDIQDSFL